MSVITENNKDHLLNYEGVEQLLVKINDRFARTDRYATPDTLGMIRAEINTEVNSEDIFTGDNHPVQITTDGNAFVNINVPTIDESLEDYYTKSEVYNKSEIDDKIDNLPESLESKFIVNDANDTNTILINRQYEENGSIDITVSDNINGGVGASITVDDFDGVAHSGLTINNGYTKIVGETQTGSSETSGGSIVLTPGSVNINAWMDEPDGGTHYSNNLSLGGNGLLLNDSEVITTQNAYANGVLLVNSQNVSNRNELTIGGFEIKNVIPYNYAIEASYSPEDPDYFYDQFSEYGTCIITAEWDKNEPVIIDRTMIEVGGASDDAYIYAYKFIITDARVYGIPIDVEDDGDGLEYQWYDFQKPVNTEVFIPAGYLDEEYRDVENGIHPIEFIDGQGSLPDTIYIDSVDALNNITVTQYAPMSLRHTSKALLNGVEVATVDQIPTTPSEVGAAPADHTHKYLEYNSGYQNTITRDLTKFPKSNALFVGAWAGSSNDETFGYNTRYGTTLDVSHDTWYQRLAFNTAPTNGKQRIEYFSGINTNNSDGTAATLTKIGDLAYLSDIPTTPAQIGAATATHTHDKFTSNLVHFDGAIHICNNSGIVSEYDEATGDEYETERITGIYFSDSVEDDITSAAYTFIREEGDDRLRVHSNYELKLSTGGNANGNETVDINGPSIRIINTPDEDDEAVDETIQMEASGGVFINGDAVATKNDIPTIPDTPIVKGSVNNSAVLKGEYTVSGIKYSNNAVSQVSTAIGAASTAGLKGYYYKAIDFANKKIYLSASQPNSIATSGFSAEPITCGYSVGDYISIVADSKFENCSKITAKSSGVITVESLPFTADDLPTYFLGAGKQPDDFTLYCANRSINSLGVMTVKNYNTGLVDMGGGALAEGVQTFATNIGAHSEGIQTHAYGQYSHAEGFRTQAGYAAHAEGKDTIASGSRSHAEGQNTVASGDMSHAQGIDTIASGSRSFATGNGTIAGGAQSITGGYKSKSVGDSAISIGHRTYAKGLDSICVGSGNAEVTTYESKTNEEILSGVKDGSIVASIALGKQSQSFGGNTFAYGDQSFASGWRTKAIGNHSHAEGNYSIAEGNNSFAGGTYSEAKGTASFATGDHTITTTTAEAAFGKYNNSTTNTLFSVGSGTSNTNRKNAFEVTKTAGYIYDKQIATINDIPTTPSQVGSAPANHNHTISLTSTFIPNVTSSYNDGVLTILGATTNVQCTGTTDVENTNANPESWFVNPDDMTALF